MINLGVVFGGKSVEHDISIITFTQVVSAIDQEKYKIIPLYLDKDNNFNLLKKSKKENYFKVEDFKIIEKNKLKNINFKKIDFFRKNGNIYAGKEKIDCVLCLCHGKDLENGVLSGFFQTLNIPTVIPNVYTSSTFHNKYLTKTVLKDNKLPVLKFYYITKSLWEREPITIYKNIQSIFKEKDKIVKPVSLGSSIGINFIRHSDNNLREEIKKALNNSFKYDDGVIIEEVVEDFTEFNQAVYKTKDEIILSKIEEVKPNNDFFSFEEKYTFSKSERILPAKIPINLKQRISKLTKKIYEIFEDVGVLRVDYLYDKEMNKLYINEINVIPGALAYYLFEARDIYFKDFLDDLIMEVLRKSTENDMITSFDSCVLDTRNGKMGKLNSN